MFVVRGGTGCEWLFSALFLVLVEPFANRDSHRCLRFVEKPVVNSYSLRYLLFVEEPVVNRDSVRVLPVGLGSVPEPERNHFFAVDLSERLFSAVGGVAVHV